MAQETGMMNDLVREIRELKQKRGAVIWRIITSSLR